MNSPLILPGDPDFDITLGAAMPPDWKSVQAATNGDFGFIVRPGSLLMEPVSGDELDEYLEGGEYDERMLELGDLEEDEW